MATLIALVVLVCLGGASDLGYASLRSEADRLQAHLTGMLQAGQQELEAGKDALRQANAKHDATFAAEATAHFVSAKNKFVSASRLADDSELLRYLEYVPSVGEYARLRHSAVDAVAEMGAAISDAGRNLSTLDGDLIKPPPGGSAGRTLLSVLGDSQSGLAKVRSDLDRARKAATQVRVDVLPSGQQATFVRARDSIDSALGGLSEFERLMPILTDVLGGNGPRRILVEQVNPAELRPGGGFIGTYTVLKADHGVLRVEQSGDAYDLANPRPYPWQAGFIALPNPYREVIPQVSWSFVDSNIYADFASNARAAENFVQPRIGAVDGVISMDYYTVAKMLELTGPLLVPGLGVALNATNFIPILIQQDLSQDPRRKAVLGSIAGPLMDRIAALPPDRWPTLLADLNSLASGRHLQAFLNGPAEQQELERVGWSGTVNPNGSVDFLMELEANAGGDKANYFLNRQLQLKLTRTGSKLHHELTVYLVNNTPYGGGGPGGFGANYLAYAQLYLSNQAASISQSLRGITYPSPSPPQGIKMTEGWLPWIPCCGSHAQAVFEYDTPWSIHDKGHHETYWQKQPGLVNDRIDVIFDDGRGNISKQNSDLSQDRLIVITPSGLTILPGRRAEATLPSLGLG